MGIMIPSQFLPTIVAKGLVLTFNVTFTTWADRESCKASIEIGKFSVVHTSL